jgi:putative mycofactocin binding protein MftB
MTIKVDSRYKLADKIKLRQEKFGGLLYQHSRGRLEFIHSPLLVRFLENDGSLSVLQQAEKIIPTKKWEIEELEKACRLLDILWDKGIIHEV